MAYFTLITAKKAQERVYDIEYIMYDIDNAIREATRKGAGYTTIEYDVNHDKNLFLPIAYSHYKYEIIEILNNAGYKAQFIKDDYEYELFIDWRI